MRDHHSVQSTYLLPQAADRRHIGSTGGLASHLVPLPSAPIGPRLAPPPPWETLLAEPYHTALVPARSVLLKEKKKHRELPNCARGLCSVL